MATLLLSLLFGTVVGFAMGLMGGGGGVFAVPMLVYGLAVAPRQAVGVSLAAVGGIALLGVLPRLGRGQVEVRTGLWFAAAGMLGAPLGSWAAGWMPETVLLVLFAGLMIVIATRMWRGASRLTGSTVSHGKSRPSRLCDRSPDGRLQITSRCAMTLLGIGLLTGILSGLFGVGGGFVIVPALVLFSGMSMHRAVGTSLLVMVLISATGVLSHAIAGRRFDWDVTGLFLLGGIVGMTLGTRLGRHLSAIRLQKVFACGIVLVALFVISRSVPFLS